MAMDALLRHEQDDWDDLFDLGSIDDASSDQHVDAVFQDDSFLELSVALTTAQSIPHPQQLDRTWGENSNNSTVESSPLLLDASIIRPKLGTRFSREVIQTLQSWLAAHQEHP